MLRKTQWKSKIAVNSFANEAYPEGFSQPFTMWTRMSIAPGVTTLTASPPKDGAALTEKLLVRYHPYMLLKQIQFLWPNYIVLIHSYVYIVLIHSYVNWKAGHSG